jgi:hypothetical protein
MAELRALRRPRQEEVSDSFRRLRDNWIEATAHLSSHTKRILDPNYQRIIGLGPAVVPLLLDELRENPRDWFWALTAITGENPVDPQDAGDIARMSRAWLEWGRQQGLT